MDVEDLDVNDEEARALLLSIDPLAELALLQDQIHQRLMDLTPTDSLDLQSLWQQTQATIDSALEEKPAKNE
jgi:DNA-directed RNA polymerase subunit F